MQVTNAPAPPASLLVKQFPEPEVAMNRLAHCTLAACATAATAAGIAFGAGAPAATTSAATNVAATSATLNGTVSPNGNQTTYYFQYGTTTSYGSQTPTAGPVKGNNDKAVKADVAGLAPSTPYHFRLVATSSTGTVNGADITFTTAAPGATTRVLSLAAAAKTVTVGRSVRLSGTLTGPGNAGQTVTLEQNPAPFAGYQSTGLTATTDASGNYSIIVAPTLTTNYRAVTGGGKKRTTSPEVAIRSHVKVTLRISDRTPRKGQRVRFSGSVLTAHDGKVARLQHRTSKGWRTVASATLVAATPVGTLTRSTYAKRLRITRSGHWRVRVAPADGDHIAGTSAVKSVKVH